MPGQAEIYAGLDAAIDLELSWSEQELPERERTKHVHRLHPYLGKFVPQLVEIFLRRHFAPGDVILDPYSGSGTTLVECSTFGAHAVGVDVSAFNVLLARVKTRDHHVAELRRDVGEVLARFEEASPQPEVGGNEYLDEWFHPQSLAELRCFERIAREYPRSHDVLRIVLSRAARSARMTTHFDLDFPKQPADGPYFCRKHKRQCTPVHEAAKFLRRYALDTVARIEEYAGLRRDVEVEVIHGDAAAVRHPRTYDGIITSPPYPGRIDYHEQHRYAFELLGLPDRREQEIGPAAAGRSRKAFERYVANSVEVFAHAREHCSPGATAIIVIDDPENLYDGILSAAGWKIVERRKRHVNRRTGRRAGEFFEDVIVARN